MTWPEYLALTWTDRWMALMQLDNTIEESNERGGGRPEDDRE